MLANYFNFIGFFCILHNLPCSHGRVLRKKTKAYFWTMNTLYVLVAITACVPGMRPVCTDEKVYPYVMNFAFCLFVINYIFHLIIHSNKEKFMTESSAEDGFVSERVEIEQVDTLDEKGGVESAER